MPVFCRHATASKFSWSLKRLRIRLHIVKEYLAKRAGEHYEEAFKAIETSLDNDTFNHLLRVTAGMESMVIGEDQILNQVWDAYLEADNAKTLGPILKHLFNRAMTVGSRVRNETGINKGAVSIGSAAVELAVTLAWATWKTKKSLSWAQAKSAPSSPKP